MIYYSFAGLLLRNVYHTDCINRLHAIPSTRSPDWTGSITMIASYNDRWTPECGEAWMPANIETYCWLSIKHSPIWHDTTYTTKMGTKRPVMNKVAPCHDIELSLWRWIDVLHHQSAQANVHVAQTPQCTSPISYNAPICNRNVHVCEHFCYKNSSLWDICLMHCYICEMCLCVLVIRLYYSLHWAMR